MKGAVLYGPRDVRFEERSTPKIVEPTDAIVRTSATCVCGSDLWPYRGLNAINGPTPMGHEYCGIVEEVGSAVKRVRPGQFVIGSFFASDNTCPYCLYGYQTSCQHREFITTASESSGRCFPSWVFSLNPSGVRDESSFLRYSPLFFRLQSTIVLADEIADLIGHRQEPYPLFLVERDRKAPQPVYGQTTLLAHF